MGDSVYCDYATTPCPNEASVGTATPGVCAVYPSDGNSSCQSDADCGPYAVCGSQGACTGFACPAQPIECPTGCTFESVPHTCGACICPACPSGTSGGSTGGSSTSGGSTGGTGGGCTADDQCSANLPAGFSIYCDYGSAYCTSGTVVEAPGSCVVYQTGATTCTTSLDCDPTQFCSLPPGCVGGSGCQGTCQDLVCGTGQTCPAECPLQNYPHACAACTCQACGGPGSDAGVGDAGCTSDLQCQAPFASYCDFTVEACGQPLGQFVEVPGSCEPNASASSCASDADCSEQDYCFNPTGACATCGTCQPVICNQPPQQCFQGCALTSVPHQCPACICPASSCCLLCN
jgi:hypothetical protein